MNSNPLGKILIIGGAITVIIGVILIFGEKIPFIGKMPGDIVIQKKNFSIYFPIVSCIILSILLSAAFYVISLIKK